MTTATAPSASGRRADRAPGVGSAPGADLARVDRVPAGVHVWHAVPPRRPAAADLAVLSPDERRRAALIRTPAVAARHVTGRALLRRLLATLLDLPPGDVVVEVDDGRPTVPTRPCLGVGVAHTDGLVVVAAAPTAVGIDVERADRWPLPPMAAWLSDRERARFERTDAGTPRPAARRALVRTWTAKEATAKGLGRGLTLSLRAIEVAGPVARVRADVGDARATWTLLDLPMTASHVVTLALPLVPQPSDHLTPVRGTWPTSISRGRPGTGSATRPA